MSEAKPKPAQQSGCRQIELTGFPDTYGCCFGYRGGALRALPLEWVVSNEVRARERLLPLQVFVGAELSAVQAFFHRYFFAVAGESRDQGVGDHVLEARVASTFEFGFADGAGFS